MVDSFLAINAESIIDRFWDLEILYLQMKILNFNIKKIIIIHIYIQYK